MMKRKVLILISTILAAAVAISTGGLVARSGHAASPPKAAAQTSGAVRFIALGDGGLVKPEKLALAQKIVEVCAARGCDFAIYLGDNFYPSGAIGAYDQQFESAFEDPFRSVRLPFYATQGNHDNSSPVLGGDGLDNRRGDSQVEYHYRRDRASRKWRMPGRYYTLRFGDVQIFNIDTNAVMDDGRGTNDPNSTKQLAWLQSSLAASTARWKIVFGHHPYISNGAHGNAGSYRGTPEPQGNGANLKAFMESGFCDKADFYFNGHDHLLEWLKPVASCGDTQFVISGVASDPRPHPNNNINEFYFQEARTTLYGFWWVEINGDTLRAVAYDANRVDPLFDKTVTKTVGTAGP